MERDDEIFSDLEQRLQTRAAPSNSSAMRLRIVEAVSAEIRHSTRRRGSIPIAWLGAGVAMFAAMLQFAGSAAVFQSDEMPAQSSVAVTPDMLKPLSNDPAERQNMAESLAFCGSTRVRLLPRIDSHFANLAGSHSERLFQETP